MRESALGIPGADRVIKLLFGGEGKQPASSDPGRPAARIVQPVKSLRSI